MNKHLLSICFLALSMRLLAQDGYHTWLNNQLQTDYGLPSLQSWVLPNTEGGTLAISYNYGGITLSSAPVGQNFIMSRIRTVSLQPNPWEAGHIYPVPNSISAGDKCLVIFWLRSDTPGARVSIFAENSTTYDKEVFSTVYVSSSWKMYIAPFESSAAYAANGINVGLHLAFGNQSVEIGGAACLNYKNTVTLAEMPTQLHNDYYPGQEPNAAWRAGAAARIDQLRKANLTVNVVTPGGQPVPGAQVNVSMQQHAFKFGTAVVSNRFNGGSAFNATYENKLLNLDGFNHGFNEVVFENDLKWPAWEQGWFSSKPQIANDVQWLHDHGISVRGHNLVWPGWGYSPPDINASATPTYIKNRIRNHLTSILGYPGIGQEMEDWDVLNEITANNDYADRFAGTPGYVTGRELYPEIFKLADSLAPVTKLYLNDYVAIEQGDQASNGISTWKSRIDELLAAGVALDGIGFQGHFSSSPTGIQRVNEIYDDFWNTYGLEAKVTEYDIDKLVPTATQADYMRDILTITFAHPSMKGFLMWGFWDGAHWLPNAPIFNEDWTIKPSGQAFIDQVFKTWWTDVTETTPATGAFTVRGFKGKYKVSVYCPDGSIQTQEVDLDGDKEITLVTSCVVSSPEPYPVVPALTCTPSIITDNVTISWNEHYLPGKKTLHITDMTGKTLQTWEIPAGVNSFEVRKGNWPAGTYFLRLEQAGVGTVVKVAIP